MNKNWKKIWIIWWWASGMAIASFLSEIDLWWNELYLIEKNDCLGKKVLITWWWRCNLTNTLKNRKDYISKYVRWWDLVSQLFENFSPKKTYKWFEDNWLRLKIEDNFRVFPASEKSQDVVRLFERKIASNNQIKILFCQQVESVELINNKFTVETSKMNFEFDCLVIASWWNAYSMTWSSWDGYHFARQLWHSVTELSPSLNSFELQENFIKNIAWITFDNAWINYNNHKLSWWLVFTQDGISGPLVFELSSHLAYTTIDKNNIYKIKLIPDISKNYEYYNDIIQTLIKENPTKQLKNILWELLPKRFVSEVVKNYIDIEKTWANFSKDERKNICHLLSFGIELSLCWKKKWEEFVTAWWVSLDEIDYRTLESKKVNNLYFAWELLNVDAVTWWFNLQFCWSSAYAVSQSIINKL